MEDNFAARLQIALDYSNKKASDLARGTGLSQALISQYLNGKFDAKNDKIAIISEYLNINELYLAGFSNDIKKQHDDSKIVLNKEKLPIYEFIPKEYPNLKNVKIIGDEDLPSELKNGSDYFALLDEGNSMLPINGIKHIVIAKKQDYANDGDIAVILIDDKNAIIRSVKKEDNLMILQPRNPDLDIMYFTTESLKTRNVRIIGVVHTSRIYW